MIDNQLLPDFVISLDEEGAPGDLLLRRFAQQHSLPDPSLYRAPVQTPVEGSQQPSTPAVEDTVLNNHVL